jgi:hypothetical protein
MAEVLSIELLWGILKDEVTDERANGLVWDCLGYRWVEGAWDNSAVAEPWRSAYPEPPNFIESRPATVMLTRSIAAEDKQLLKQSLGFEGYKINELVPRKTRRATMVNWLLGYMRRTDRLAVNDGLHDGLNDGLNGPIDPEN